MYRQTTDLLGMWNMPGNIQFCVQIYRGDPLPFPINLYFDIFGSIWIISSFSIFIFIFKYLLNIFRFNCMFNDNKKKQNRNCNNYSYFKMKKKLLIYFSLFSFSLSFFSGFHRYFHHHSLTRRFDREISIRRVQHFV